MDALLMVQITTTGTKVEKRPQLGLDLLLLEGRADGPIHVQIPDTKYDLYILPHASLDEYRHHKKMNQAGIYFILGIFLLKMSRTCISARRRYVRITTTPLSTSSRTFETTSTSSAARPYSLSHHQKTSPPPSSVCSRTPSSLWLVKLVAPQSQMRPVPTLDVCANT